METILLLAILAVFLLSLLAQGKVSSTYRRYSEVYSYRGITSNQVVEQILREAGASDVRIERVRGQLTDHYDPRHKVIRLSDPVYDSASVAAIGVAAHEAGHAAQYAKGYFPIKVRSAVLPAVQFSYRWTTVLLLIGILLSGISYYATFCIYIAIGLFAVTTFFQFVTLPVEFNASRRAVAALREHYSMSEEELDGVKRVLRAAAMTYVAAFAMSLLQLLRYIVIFTDRGRRR